MIFYLPAFGAVFNRAQSGLVAAKAGKKNLCELVLNDARMLWGHASAPAPAPGSKNRML
jgi:hypothetical protein